MTNDLRNEIAQILADWLVSNKPPHDGADAILAKLDPDALIVAALEAASDRLQSCPDSHWGPWCADAIRALAADTEARAAIKAKAGFV